MALNSHNSFCEIQPHPSCSLLCFHAGPGQEERQGKAEGSEFIMALRARFMRMLLYGLLMEVLSALLDFFYLDMNIFRRRGLSTVGTRLRKINVRGARCRSGLHGVHRQKRQCEASWLLGLAAKTPDTKECLSSNEHLHGPERVYILTGFWGTSSSNLDLWVLITRTRSL